MCNRTNRDAALSTKGVEQVEETCRRLKEQVMQPTIVRYSLAAAAIDTADIVGKELKVSGAFVITSMIICYFSSSNFFKFWLNSSYEYLPIKDWTK